MNLVSYLVDIYGYNTPIFIKDIRIGGKSKTAIRQEFYRASQRGELNRDGPGVYSIVNKTNEIVGSVTFEKIIESKFLYNENCPDLYIDGYYSGLTFLNQIGVSQQVPAILEVTTNNTSSKKRIYSALNRKAIIRKGRTNINLLNYKILQFLDMFYFVSLREVIENKDLLVDYVKKNKLSKQQFEQYIKYYSTSTIKKIVEGGIIYAFI